MNKVIILLIQNFKELKPELPYIEDDLFEPKIETEIIRILKRDREKDSIQQILKESKNTEIKEAIEKAYNQDLKVDNSISLSSHFKSLLQNQRLAYIKKRIKENPADENLLKEYKKLTSPRQS